MGHLSAYLTSHPRTRDMSISEFSRLVGIAKSSAKAILDGTSIPEDRTLQKIAIALPELQLTLLRECALRDTPVELPEGIELLDLDERNLLKRVIQQLLKSSGKEARAQQLSAGEIEELRHKAAGNVVELPRPQLVQKAAYDPPEDE